VQLGHDRLCLAGQGDIRSEFLDVVVIREGTGVLDREGVGLLQDVEVRRTDPDDRAALFWR